MNCSPASQKVRKNIPSQMYSLTKVLNYTKCKSNIAKLFNKSHTHTHTHTFLIFQYIIQ